MPAFAIGVLSGLLANSGGVLLVPMCILLLGLTAARAAGTSIVAAGALSDPDARSCTCRSGTSTGPSPWCSVSGSFPVRWPAAASASASPRPVARPLFGVALVAFAGWFLAPPLTVAWRQPPFDG